MTTTATSNAEETLDYLRQVIAAGEHWYIALLKAMSSWRQAEEEIDGRTHRYLIGGEVFDYLLLCERFMDELGDMVGAKDRDALLFHGHPPLEIADEEFQVLLLLFRELHEDVLAFGVLEPLPVCLEEAMRSAFAADAEEQRLQIVRALAEPLGALGKETVRRALEEQERGA